MGDRSRKEAPFVVDVRPGPEYTSGHLPGVRHIPGVRHSPLADRFAQLPRGSEIVAYCRGRSCVLAHDAVRLLRARGLRARRAADGALEWRLAGLRVEPGSA